MTRPPVYAELMSGLRGCPSAGRGFTLLELLIVMALIILSASAFAFALNRSLPGVRASTAGDGIVRTVRDAQSQARATGTPVRLLLVDDGLAVAGTEPRPVAMESAAADTTSHQVTMRDWAGRPIASLILFPDGSSTGATVIVRLGQHERRIRVSEFTGRITVERAQP